MEKIKIIKNLKNINDISYGVTYVEQPQIRIGKYGDSICFTDLTNALSNKSCETIYFNTRMNFYDFLGDFPLENFLENIPKKIYSNKKDCLESLGYLKIKEEKKVFSPFKKVKEIIYPEKWTLPHVWKAILAGQVEKIICRGEYTDDYAYDSSINFNKKQKDQLLFARDLIEEPSGWRVSKVEDDKVLSVCCHLFNLNNVYLK